MIPTGLSVKVLGQKLNIAMRHLNGISTEFPYNIAWADRIIIIL